LGKYPPLEKVEISTIHYIMGLGDIPGELRREALDSLRKGDINKAQAYLEQMEEIYMILISMEEVSLLLKGLRRKLDIARGVIERTRGDITTEAGRIRLIEGVKQLTEKL
jgi:translin